MVKGHMDQAQKNQKSTKTANEPADPNDDFSPTVQDERSHFCFAALTKITGQVYSDQTGKFTFPSSNGNNYLFILYDYDSNLIMAEPMKSRCAQDIVDAYKTVHTKLCRAGLHPKLAHLDNECSAALKTFLIDEKIDYQLVPPGTHHCAIRTFKNHFIAGLCSVDKDFPLHLWDRLVEQAVITLIPIFRQLTESEN
jgi:hypothetical protein